MLSYLAFSVQNCSHSRKAWIFISITVVLLFFYLCISSAFLLSFGITSLGKELYYCLNWEFPASMTPLFLKFQHTLMFARPARTLDDLVLSNPMQGNLPLRYACSAQTLSRKNELSFFFNIWIKIYVFIQKTTTFISVGVDITFFFPPSSLTRRLNLFYL